MTASLDTTVLIDVMNGRSERVRHLYSLGRAEGADWIISAIAYHEVLFGSAVRGKLDAERALLHRLFEGCAVADFSSVHAQEAAVIRTEMRLQGTPLEGYDLLIAAQARAEGWAVATGKLKHFNPVPGLVVEDWSG